MRKWLQNFIENKEVCLKRFLNHSLHSMPEKNRHKQLKLNTLSHTLIKWSVIITLFLLYKHNPILFINKQAINQSLPYRTLSKRELALSHDNAAQNQHPCFPIISFWFLSFYDSSISGRRKGRSSGTDRVFEGMPITASLWYRHGEEVWGEV